MQIRPATPDEIDDVFDLLTARNRAAFGVSELRLEHLRNAWAVEGTDRFVAVNGAIAGYADLDSAADIQIAARENAVNDALLDEVERRAAERGLAHVSAIVLPEDAPFHALVQRSGFTHRGDVLRMWRPLRDDLPAPVWAPGVTVRTYGDGDAEQVQSLLDEAYAGWDASYVPRPHEDWLHWMTGHDEFDPALWFLVERDGELVACALLWKEQNRCGWVKDIVVRESERGRGLAKALLHEGFRAYGARGADRVGLKVDSTNPTGAIELYERVGFEIDRRYGIWVKPL